MSAREGTGGADGARVRALPAVETEVCATLMDGLRPQDEGKRQILHMESLPGTQCGSFVYAAHAQRGSFVYTAHAR